MTLHSSREIPSLKGRSIEVLSRITGRATARHLEALLADRLAMFGLSLTDLSGMTTDGASVMSKLARSLEARVSPRPFFHQQCQAHALHLAVWDALSGTSEPANEDEQDATDVAESEAGSWNFAGVLGVDEGEKRARRCGFQAPSLGLYGSKLTLLFGSCSRR